MRRYGWKNKNRQVLKQGGNKFNCNKGKARSCYGSIKKSYKNEKMTVVYELEINGVQDLRELLRLLAINSRHFYLDCINHIRL